MQVTKRDGRKVQFDRELIELAVEKAAVADGWGEIEARNMGRRIGHSVETGIANEGKYLIDIEHIQDVVEETLMVRYPSVAKAYILYREKRTKMRRINSEASVALINEYVGAADWRVKENSNMGFSLQGLNNYISSDISAEYWLNSIYTEEIRKAHISGDLHIHDLGLLAPYCNGWDLMDLLKTGFRGVAGKTSFKPPNNLQAALGQIVSFLFTLQGEAAGAQAFSSFDTLLAPFVRKDNLCYEQVKQLVQSFVCQMNVATRVGGQPAFTNITLDMLVPSTYRDTPVVIGGKEQDTTYGEYQAEMDMLNRAFAEIMCEGDADGRIFTFPIPTYNITKDFDWESPRFNPVWVMSGKLGVPYFANFVNSDMSPDDARSMCPMHPDTEVLVRTSKGEYRRKIVDMFNRQNTTGTKYEVRNKGAWKPATVVRTEADKCVRIKLVNGVSVVFDIRHEQPVLDSRDGDFCVKTAGSAQIGEFLPFNVTQKEEKEQSKKYLVGKIVGAYLGDGSYSDNAGVFSLNKTTKNELLEEIRSFFENFGFNCAVRDHDKTLLKSLYVKGKSGAFKGWMSQFIEGEKADTKRITKYAFSQGADFCEGLLEGWYATDGGNRGRIYTTSRGLVEDFSSLCGYLGYGYDISGKDTRGDGYKENTEVFVLKFHKRENYGDFFFRKFDYHWVRIAEIEEVKSPQYVYCVAIEDEEHLFELGNGLVTHNCRLRLDNRELRKRGGGLFGANPLTGSMGVVTLNLPRLAYDAKTEPTFFDRLEKLMGLAKDSLCLKRRHVEEFTECGLYPYSRFYLREVKNRFGKYWANHFSTIGLVGMNEACLNLFGEGIASQRGKEFAERVLTFMRDKMASYQEETGDNFNLEASPAEGTSFRLALLDRRSGRDMVFANGKSEPGKTVYYTNSSQLPVGHTEDLFAALDHQDSLQSLYTGGTVLHGFLGEEVKDPETVKRLVKTITDNYSLPYFTLTPTFSVCSDHGYLSGEVSECPTCGNDTEVYSRVVGYYRPVSSWNEGKAQEFLDRQEFVVPEA